MGGLAAIVTDLGFGDSGKGTTTEWLVRRCRATRVVRYNGGAQAGHNVVTEDGRHHTFAQLGAGSFVEGVETHLSRFMVVHPGGLLQELELLESKGVAQLAGRLTVSPQARLISPFQQAANRLRELARGSGRHGSCGVGVGECVSDSLTHPEDCIRAADLANLNLLRRKAQAQQERKRAEFEVLRRELSKEPAARGEWRLLESGAAVLGWLERLERLRQILTVRPLQLQPEERVVFEGAQGVLLDEWRGFHPYTTWSTCTFDNALQLLEGWKGQVVRLGVLRSYATRHGAGPFPTEDPVLDWKEPHNGHGPWQGRFRLGWPDLLLQRYALEACGGVDGLVLTHMDRLSHPWKAAVAYRSAGGERLTELKLGPFQDLEYQQGLTDVLQSCHPEYETISARDYAAWMEDSLGARIWLESYGPQARHKCETEASRLASTMSSWPGSNPR